MTCERLYEGTKSSATHGSLPHDPGVVPRADLPVDEIIPIADTVVVRSDPQAATA